MWRSLWSRLAGTAEAASRSHQPATISRTPATALVDRTVLGVASALQVATHGRERFLEARGHRLGAHVAHPEGQELACTRSEVALKLCVLGQGYGQALD